MTPWSVSPMAGMFEVHGLLHQIVNAARAVQQAVFRMQVQMDKIGRGGVHHGRVFLEIMT